MHVFLFPSWFSHMFVFLSPSFDEFLSLETSFLPVQWDLLFLCLRLKHSSVHLWNVTIEIDVLLCKDANKNCKNLLAQINVLYVEDVYYHKHKNISSTNHQWWIILCQQNLEFTKYGRIWWKLGFHDVSRLSSNPYKTWALLLFYCSLQKLAKFYNWNR